MRVTVDADRCQGYGQCCLEAPAVFELPRPDAAVRVLLPAIPEDRAGEVENAVDLCPMQALRIDG